MQNLKVNVVVTKSGDTNPTHASIVLAPLKFNALLKFSMLGTSKFHRAQKPLSTFDSRTGG